MGEEPDGLGDELEVVGGFGLREEEEEDDLDFGGGAEDAGLGDADGEEGRIEFRQPGVRQADAFVEEGGALVLPFLDQRPDPFELQILLLLP